MTLSKKEEAALIIVTELAKKPDALVSISNIASFHAISIPFLKKTARFLKKEGIVVSKEGVGGGYCLAKPAHEITVLSVLSAVEGGSVRRSGSFGSDTRICPLRPDCIPQNIRRLISATILSYLSGVTIDQFIRQKKSL